MAMAVTWLQTSHGKAASCDAWLEDLLQTPTLRPALIRRMPRFNLAGEIKTLPLHDTAYQVPGFDSQTWSTHALNAGWPHTESALRSGSLPSPAHIPDYK